MADRIAVMYAGRIVEQGLAERVLCAPQHPYTKALLACVPPSLEHSGSPRPSRLPVIEGSAPDPELVIAGCAFAPRCAKRAEICTSRAPVPIGTTIALLAGVFAGAVAGFYGRWIDSLTMRLVELFLALPWLYLLFAFRAILPLSIKTTDAFLLFVAVIGLVGWARPARLVRGIVLSAKERNFVLAARAMGASDLHILRMHVLPQTYALILTLAALLIPQFILAEVTLSFLGLGVGEPVLSWGNLLAELQNYSVLTSSWWMYLPAAALILLFLAYHCASSALQHRTAADL